MEAQAEGAEPGETRPTEAEPRDAESLEKRSTDAGPRDVEPVEKRVTDSRPRAAEPVKASSTEAGPWKDGPPKASTTGTGPADAEPPKNRSNDAGSREARPVNKRSTEAGSHDAEPVKVSPADAGPGHPEAVEKRSTEAESRDTPAGATEVAGRERAADRSLSSDQDRDARTPATPGFWLRPWRSTDFVVLVVVGVLAGVLSSAALAAGLTGWPAWCLLLGCLLIIPSSTNLSLRIVINLILAHALTYLHWLTGLQLPGSHGAAWLVALAIIAATSATLAALGLRGQLLPKFEAIDALPPLFALTAAWIAFRRWFVPTTFEQALETMGTAWDNSSHFYIVATMHRTQRLTRRLPPRTDEFTNGFEAYPVGYHSSAASLVDLFVGNTADASALPGVFLTVVGVLAGLSVLLVGCSIAAIPKVRSAASWGGLAVGLATSIMAFGPGLTILLDAHYNFHFAAAMAFAACALSLHCRGVFDPKVSGCLLAAIMCAAAAWLPLGGMAALLSLGIFLPAGPSNWRAKPWQRIWIAGLAVIVLVVTAIAASWTSSEITGEVIAQATGGVTPIPALFAALTITTLLVQIIAGRPSGPAQIRLRTAQLIAVLGALIYSIIEASVMAANDQQVPAYYPQKILNGLVLLTSLVVVTGVAFIDWPDGARAKAGQRSWRIKQALAAVLGFTALLMAQIPAFGMGGNREGALSVVHVDEDREGILVHACQRVNELPEDTVAVVATGYSLDTLLCEVNRGTNFEIALFLTAKIEDYTGGDLVWRIWSDLRDDKIVLLVDPKELRKYRELLGPAYADRAISWGS